MKNKNSFRQRSARSALLLGVIAIANTALAADTLTGTWGGGRTAMEEKGITLEASYIGEYANNLSGGAAQGTAYLDNTSIGLGIDFDKLFGLTGGSFYFNLLGNNNYTSTPSTLVGDAQGVSNIEAPQKWQLYEAWYQQNFGDAVSLKLGLYDLNTEFDVVETSGLFLNGSHGIVPTYSQSGPPIFPQLSPALRASFGIGSHQYLQTAVMTGAPGDDPTNPNDTLIALEYGYTTGGEGSQDTYSKYALGLWYYSTAWTMDAVGGAIAPTNNQGFYLLAERSLTRESGHPEQGLNAFVRYGAADATLNQFDSYLGAGLVYTGLFPSRDEDQLGLAVAMVKNGATFKMANPTFDNETNIELSYRMQITPWFAIQPDIQYVMNPGTDPTVPDATYFALRFEIVL